MTEQNSKQLTRYLSSFSDQIAATPAQVSEVKSIMQRLKLLIDQRSKFKPARVRMAGSVEKGTALAMYMDLDCFMYLNNVRPPYDAVLSEWDDIITLNFSEAQDHKTNSFSAQFTIGGIGVDVVPATNLATGASGDVIMEQHRAMISEIRSKPLSEQADYANQNSAGLSEATVYFMKQQSAFAHRLARLCKYWNLTIYSPRKISGRSSAMELLAVHAAKEEEAYSSSPDILNAFRRFLASWSAALSGKQFPVLAVYDPSLVDAKIKQQKPLLMDPANPWNNRFEPFKPEDLRHFADCAKETLSRLDNIAKADSFVSELHMQLILHKLFWPQPKIYQLPEDQRPFTVPKKWMMSIENGWKATLPSVQQRAQGSKHHESILKLFASVTTAAVHSCKQVGQTTDVAEHGKKEITAFLQEVITGTAQSWGPSDVSHDKADVTYNIPLLDGSGRVARVSAY